MHEVSSARVIVLVEGVSDQRAVAALARLRGRDLDAEQVAIVPIGGAQAVGRDRRLAGLCDAAEESLFRRALERAGLGRDLSREAMETLGFYVCTPDLEGELIRALGADQVEQVAAGQGDLGAFRTLQTQPQWRGRPAEEQLRRWLGSGGRRKLRYAELLVDAALDLDRVPRPLAGLVDRL